MNKYNSPCSDEQRNSGECYSGISRIATAFKQYQCDVRVHAGDFVQGSVYDTIFGDEIARVVYQHLQYDIATFGNHEFNKGVQPIYRTIASAPHKTTWLSSNTLLNNAPNNVTLVDHLDTCGVCWVSALTPATLSISNPGPTVRITDPAVAIMGAVTKCSQNHSVIAVTHVGIDADLELCRNVPQLDLVIGGHSHTDLAQGMYPTKVTRADGSACWVVQALAFGRYLGVLDVSFDEGELVLSGSQYVPLDRRIGSNIDTDNLLRVYTQRLANSIRKQVGTVTTPIDGARGSCRAKECAMGNLVCDAVLVYAAPQEGATICIQNGGGIRASFDVGPVTVEEILSVLPFGNVHAVLTIDGETLMSELENGLLAIRNTEINGRMPQVGGITVEASFAAPPGARLRRVLVDGKPIGKTTRYRVVTNAFLANGGDGYKWSSATDINVSGRGLDTLLAEYLTANDPYTPPANAPPRIIDVDSAAL